MWPKAAGGGGSIATGIFALKSPAPQTGQSSLFALAFIALGAFMAWVCIAQYLAELRRNRAIEASAKVELPRWEKAMERWQ